MNVNLQLKTCDYGNNTTIVYDVSFMRYINCAPITIPIFPVVPVLK